MRSKETSSTQRRRGVLSTALGVTAALVLLGCASAPSGDDSGDAAAPEANGSDGDVANLSITFVPKNLGNPYFDASDAGGAEAVGEFGGTYDRVAPTENSPAGQVPFINTLNQQGVGAIVLSATDPQAACGALNEARDAGVKVVTYDSDTDAECRDVFINQATAEGIALAQVELIAEQIGGSGEIAIHSGSPNAPTQNLWIELMTAELEANYPDITVVDIVYSNNVDQEAFDVTAGLVQSYPNLKGIIAPDTVAIASGAQYLQSSEFKGTVALTGLGLPNQMRDYVLDGTVTAFALWSPADMGYLAAWASKALIEGTITGAEGDEFSAGKLGDYTVGAGGVVLLGPPTKFNADNIGDFDF